MSNHTSSQMEWKLAQNTCGLKIFLAEVGQDEKDQLEFRHPSIIDTIEGANTITPSLASKLSRSMRMLAETYGKENHYLCKAASLPTLTLAAMLEMTNCRW